MERLRGIRDRPAPRVPGVPDDATLRNHLETLGSSTLRTPGESGAWATLMVGGEEVDIDVFSQQGVPAAPDPTRAPAPN